MNETENDPQQCRILREIEREILRQIDSKKTERQNLESDRDKVRADILRMNARLQEFERAAAAAAFASVMRGDGGAAIGALATELGIKIDRTRDQIR